MEASRGLPGDLALRIGAIPLAFLAASLGGAYALTAYSFGAAVLPLSAVAVAALSIGIWRLEWGLAIFLFALPFAENIETARPEEAPLRSALVLWLAALAAVQVGRVAARRERLRVPRLGMPIIGFVAAAAVGFAIAPSSGGASKLVTLVGGSVVFLLIALVCDEPRRIRTVLIGLSAGVLGVALHSIWQYATGQVGTAGFVTDGGAVEFRISSTFSSPNPLAGFLTLGVPLGVGLFRLARTRWAKTLALALAALALAATVLTFSRGALVGLAALPLVFLRDWRAWPVIAMTLAAVVVLAPGLWQARLSQVTDRSSTEVATRLDFWETALVSFEEHPVAGTGLDTFQQEYLDRERSGRTFLGGSGSLSAPRTAHNLYLNTLAELGLIGGIALALLVVAVLRLGVLLRRVGGFDAIGLAVLGAAIVLFVHNFFDVTLLDPKNLIQAMAVFGVGSAAWQAASRTT